MGGGAIIGLTAWVPTKNNDPDSKDKSYTRLKDGWVRNGTNRGNSRP